MTDVFVSYCGDNGKKIADAFKAGLPKIAEKLGLPNKQMKVFVAHSSIRPGAKWEKEIWENLHKCKWFFLVVTADSNKSHYAQQELGAAIALNKKVIPLLGKGMSPAKLPGFLKSRQAVILSDTHGVEDAKDKIAWVTSDVIMQKKAEIKIAQDKEKKNQTGNALLAVAGVIAALALLIKKF